MISEKLDVKEFTKLAIEFHSINPKLFEKYTDRMIGAVEAQKMLEKKEVS